jgi:predicted nucleotidyltransferase
VAEHNGLNPRVFGSVARGNDGDKSDLDLPIDAGEGLDLFGIAKMQMAVGVLVQTPVDTRTPEDMSPRFRQQVLAEAKPL